MNMTTLAEELTDGKTAYFTYDFSARKQRRGGKPIDREIARENLFRLQAVFEQHEIPFWLMGKTCLGALYNGDFIWSDSDTDIGMRMEHRDRLIAATLGQLGAEDMAYMRFFLEQLQGWDAEPAAKEGGVLCAE